MSTVTLTVKPFNINVARMYISRKLGRRADAYITTRSSNEGSKGYFVGGDTEHVLADAWLRFRAKQHQAKYIDREAAGDWTLAAYCCKAAVRAFYNGIRRDKRRLEALRHHTVLHAYMMGTYNDIPEQWQYLARLIVSGSSGTDIAKMLGVNKMKISRMVKQLAKWLWKQHHIEPDVRTNDQAYTTEQPHSSPLDIGQYELTEGKPIAYGCLPCPPSVAVYTSSDHAASTLPPCQTMQGVQNDLDTWQHIVAYASSPMHTCSPKPSDWGKRYPLAKATIARLTK